MNCEIINLEEILYSEFREILRYLLNTIIFIDH